MTSEFSPQQRAEAGVPNIGALAIAQDLVLVPGVALTLVARRLTRAVLHALVWVLDLAFPVLLQLARIPLAAARLLGDGLALLATGAISCFPVRGEARERWRAGMLARWRWIRARLSYRAFEAAVHVAFERGMAWVFRRCSRLSPSGAVLVIFAALLWIPISFGGATALHAFLLANAAVLPPWTQLLHPAATILAKSKLLVLPVYPAAWPQAKKHALVRGTFSAYAYLAGLRICRRTVHLYRRLAAAWAYLGAALSRMPPVRLGRNAAVTLDGALRRQRGANAFSGKVRASYARWSIKFTPQYYEIRELEKGPVAS